MTSELKAARAALEELRALLEQPAPPLTLLRTQAAMAAMQLEAAHQVAAMHAAQQQAREQHERLTSETRERADREVATAQQRLAEARHRAAQDDAARLEQELELALRSTKHELQAHYQQRILSLKAELLMEPAAPSNPDDAFSRGVFAREQELTQRLHATVGSELERCERRLALVGERAL